MARFVDAIDLPLPPAEAFDDLAAFHRTAEWDPGIVRAERLDAGPIGVGSRFRVVASFLGRELPLVYEITRFEPPHRLVLVGSDGSLTAIDEIACAPRGDGTRVTWEARLELAGWQRLLDPALGLAFQWIGRAAARGLRARHAGRTGGSTRTRAESAGTAGPTTAGARARRT